MKQAWSLDFFFGFGFDVCLRLRACARRRRFENGIEDKSDQVDRAIRTGKLNALPRLHTRPINVVVYHGSV